MALRNPLEEFFEKEEKLTWLRAQVQTAGGYPATVDVALKELLEEKAQRVADAQSLVLPSLQVGSAEMTLRTTREGSRVLGSILDYLRWLGVEDEWGHTWKNCLRDEFRAELDKAMSFRRSVGALPFVAMESSGCKFHGASGRASVEPLQWHASAD